MTSFLLLAFIFLCAGVIAVPIATRLGLGSVLGYLIAGIIIGPLLALLHVDVIAIQHFAEFGVVMMLFLVGLELEPKLLWQMRHRLTGLGGGQLLLTTFAVMATAMLFGQPWTIALAIGLVLALSSTAIVLQTLNEKGLMKSDGGQSSFSVLLFQDIAVIPMLALMSLLALPELVEIQTAISQGQGEGHGSNLSLVEGLNGWQRALVTLGAVGTVVLCGNHLTRPVFRFIAAAELRELFTAAALMMVVGIALLMTLAGLSPALGTFLAGVVLANSEYKHELESDIDPFKGLLLGLFFMTVGASIDFELLNERAGYILSLTAGLIALKAVVLLALSFIFKIKGSDRWLLALGLAQAGEFGFVLLSLTVSQGVIPVPIADQLLLIVALSMLFTPALFIIYDKLIVPRFVTLQDRDADDMPEADDHVIIAGRGRVGGLVDRMLTAAAFKTTVIDYSSKQLDIMRKFGFHAYYGDATRPDLLHAAGLAKAKLLIVTIDGKEQINTIVKYAVQNHPNVHVIARAVDRNHVYELWSLGCRDIIRETYDSALRIGRSGFEAMGYSREKAERMVGAFNAADRRSMIEVADVFDVAIPAHENEALIKRVRDMQKQWEPELRAEIDAIIKS